MSQAAAELASQAVNAHLAWQRELELEWLIDLLWRREPPRIVLEIGVWRGGTFWLWSQLAADDALLLGLEAGLPDGEQPRIEVRGGQRAQIGSFDSHSLEAWLWVQGRPAHTPNWRGVTPLFDLLHIDGDHGAEGVRQDWETYVPLVRPGGVVILHDVGGEAAVREFWQTLDCPKQQFIEDPESWGGIGVIEIGDSTWASC